MLSARGPYCQANVAWNLKKKTRAIQFTEWGRLAAGEPVIVNPHVFNAHVVDVMTWYNPSAVVDLHWRRQLSPRWINPQVKGPGRAGWFVTGWDTSPYIYATDSDTCSHCEPRFPWLSKFVLTWNEGIGLCRSAEYKHHPRQEVVRGSLLCYWHWHQTPLLRLRYIFKKRCHKKEQVQILFNLLTLRLA